MAEIDPQDWRTWPRHGDRVEAPNDATMKARMQAVWELTCESYGIDPRNPPPMRKDIFRKGRICDQ